MNSSPTIVTDFGRIGEIHLTLKLGTYDLKRAGSDALRLVERLNSKEGGAAPFEARTAASLLNWTFVQKDSVRDSDGISLGVLAAAVFEYARRTHARHHQR